MTQDVFTASGTFTPPAGVTSVDVLIVAGGGGGGRSSAGAGGGGAGGVRWVTGIAVTPGVGVTVTVGNGGGGGATSNSAGSTGGDSVFGATTSLGGGGGGGGTTGTRNGLNGGSGGGGGGSFTSQGTGGTGTAGQGNNGGGGGNPTNQGGGGGGAGGVGSNASTRTGGAGVDMSANVGTSVGVSGFFGGGGGGNATSGGGGAGGSGGGGAGGSASAGTSGTPNTGGGGGGGSTGGTGGTGVVIVVYTAAGGTPTTISGAQATETDTALAGSVTAGARVAGGQAVETDAALAGTTTAGAVVAGGQAVETDTALAGAVTFAEIIPGGQATETDTALPGTVTVGAVVAGGQAQETDEALPGEVADANTILGGQAVETDEALPGTVVLGYGATDTANRVGGRRRGGYAVATWDPPIADPPPTIVLGEARDRANAFGPVSMNGTQAVYDVSTVTKQRHRDRIVVGGKDITYWRDVRTPLPTYQLVSPLLYGPATLRLPQVAAAFEQVGVGDLSWLQREKTVKIQRVDAETGEVMATDYKGVIVAFNASGRDLTVEIGGEASGRAALQERQPPIFRETHDIGMYAWRAISQYLGLPFEPRMGPTTGIELARFGGTGMLDYISQLCARGWTRSGTQWTIAPVNGVYRMFRKDTTTVDATAYLDDARTVADLRRDIAEEPNRIYATGITPDGQRVRFGAYPGLKQSRPAPYPFTNDRNFGVGTTDAETDTGDGITVMIAKLRVQKYVTTADAPGGYDNDVASGIRQLQDDAGLPTTGTMTPATWRALYDLDATGFSLRWSHIAPAAQRAYTRPYITSGSGAIMRRNPLYDRTRLKIDRTIDMGSGFTIAQMREFAEAERDRAEDNWVGTLTFHTGALVAGSHGHSFTPTVDDVFRARRLKPGMNIRLPHSPGGDITVHVSAVSVDEDGKVTATVDTQARDSMAVWEVIERNRESRRDPARQWIKEHRASGQIKDAIDGWDEVGGLLGDTLTIPGHQWTVFEIVAGQEGTVQALRTRTNPNAEYVMAVFGKHVHPKRLERRIGNPLTAEGKDRWSDEGVRNDLDRDRFLLYVGGSDEEPLGYYPRKKDGDHPLTGRFEDAAGFSYRTFAQPVIYVAVYADRDTSIPAGRIMWPQLEAGA